MSIRFHVIGITRDRRADWQLRHYRAMVAAAAADQKAADEEILREFQERVRKNELRRVLSHSIINLPAMTG